MGNKIVRFSGREHILGFAVMTLIAAFTFFTGCERSSERELSEKTGALQIPAPTPTRLANAGPPAEAVPQVASTPAPTPTPEPERLVTLTTTTTLRELAVELTRQTGIDYGADDNVADTTVTIHVKDAPVAEVEELVFNQANVTCVRSDREIEQRWVHFASPR